MIKLKERLVNFREDGRHRKRSRASWNRTCTSSPLHPTSFFLSYKAVIQRIYGICLINITKFSRVLVVNKDKNHQFMKVFFHSIASERGFWLSLLAFFQLLHVFKQRVEFVRFICLEWAQEHHSAGGGGQVGSKRIDLINTYNRPQPPTTQCIFVSSTFEIFTNNYFVSQNNS